MKREREANDSMMANLKISKTDLANNNLTLMNQNEGMEKKLKDQEVAHDAALEEYSKMITQMEADKMHLDIRWKEESLR